MCCFCSWWYIFHCSPGTYVYTLIAIVIFVLFCDGCDGVVCSCVGFLRVTRKHWVPRWSRVCQTVQKTRYSYITLCHVWLIRSISSASVVSAICSGSAKNKSHQFHESALPDGTACYDTCTIDCTIPTHYCYHYQDCPSSVPYTLAVYNAHSLSSSSESKQTLMKQVNLLMTFIAYAHRNCCDYCFDRSQLIRTNFQNWSR